MTRRRFLVWGAALLSISGLAGFYRLLRSFSVASPEELAALIVKELPYLNHGDAALGFARDFCKVDRARPVYFERFWSFRYQEPRDRILSAYLLSTNFFPSADETKRLSYMGPRTVCGNPFAQFVER